jgi:hypothetical protein
MGSTEFIQLEKIMHVGYRTIRTTQERKMSFIDPDVIETGLHVSGRNRANRLPSSWDDIHRHSDKCWKTQSKRKHQYK